MTSQPTDPLEEIGQHLGQALRTTVGAGLHAASVQAMLVERRARSEATRHRRRRVEMVQHRRTLDQTGTAAARARGGAPDQEAARWLAAITAAGGAELADQAWRSPGWDALAERLRSGEAQGHDGAAALAKVVPHRGFDDGKDVAAILEWRVTREFEQNPVVDADGPAGAVAVDQELTEEAAEYESLLHEAQLEVEAITALHIAAGPDPTAPSAVLWDQLLADAHIEAADAATTLEQAMAHVESETERLAAGPDQNAGRWLTAIADVAGEDLAHEAWASMYWPALATDLDRHQANGHDVAALLREALTQDPIDAGAHIAGTLHWRLTELVGDDRLGQQAAELADTTTIDDTWQWTADDMLIQRRRPSTHRPLAQSEERPLDRGGELDDRER